MAMTTNVRKLSAINSVRRRVLAVSPIIFSPVSLVGASTTSRYSIGVEFDRSNRLDSAGSAIVEGVKQALELFNAKGGPAVGLQLLEHDANLLKTDHLVSDWVKKSPVLGLMGGGGGGTTAQLVQWSERNQVPYGVAWASNADLLNGHTTTLRLASTDLQAVTYAMELAMQATRPKWGLLLVNDALGRSTFDALAPWMSQAPYASHFVGARWHSIGAQEIGSQWNSLRMRGAQWIFLVGHPRSTLELSSNLQKLNLDAGPPVFCSSNAWDPTLYRLTRGGLARQKISFSLPKRSNPIYQAVPSQLKEPASWNAFVLTQMFLQAFDTARIQLGGSFSEIAAKDLRRLMLNVLPSPQEISDTLSTQYYAYNEKGSFYESDSQMWLKAFN